MTTAVSDSIDDLGGLADADAFKTRITPVVASDFMGSSDVAHFSLRSAARVNAGTASDAEMDKLLSERAALLNEALASPLTRAKLDRLEYVRWSLDRIEDARHGDALDTLEALVDRYKQALREVQNLRSNLEGHRFKSGR